VVSVQIALHRELTAVLEVRERDVTYTPLRSTF
jgi:hypothetical protein